MKTTKKRPNFYDTTKWAMTPAQEHQLNKFCGHGITLVIEHDTSDEMPHGVLKSLPNRIYPTWDHSFVEWTTPIQASSMDTKSSYDWTVSLKDSTKWSKFERTKKRKIIITLITGYDSGSAKEGRNGNKAEVS